MREIQFKSTHLAVLLLVFLAVTFVPRKTYATVNSKTEIVVHGQVKDAGGEPMIGVTVSLEGAAKGTMTDPDGRYSLRVSKKTHNVLIFTFIGYAKQKKVITNADKPINVVMIENSKKLDEVVVVGYGSQKKVNLTGSVSSIDFTKQNESRPITTVSSALAGLSSGVQVMQDSGQPGADGATITIRGAGTLNNTTPLVIVDGMEGSIDDVNPQDIQNISVLKDAAASAIYGAQAANGVIIITTKTGKSGHININYSGRLSYAQPMRLTKTVSNYADYMEYMNESFTNIDQSPIFNQSTIDTWREKSLHPNDLNDLGVPNYVAYPNVSWEKAVFKNNIINDHNISLSGGSDNVHFLLSGHFLDNPGLVDNTGIKQYNIRANVEAKITKWLTAGMRTYGGMMDADPGDVNKFIDYLFVTSPGVYPKWNGKFGYPEAPEEDANASTLLTKVNQRLGKDRKSHFNTTFYTKVQILKGLEWDFNFNYDRHWDENKYHIVSPARYKLSTDEILGTETDPSQIQTAFDDKSNYSYTLENVLHYNTTIHKYHHFSALAGYQERYYYQQDNGAKKKGLIDPDINVPDAAVDMVSINGSATDWATRSFFARVNYDYKSRYLFEGDMRADGSSRYYKTHRWGVFPSFSAAWRISEESFMKPSRSWLDNLKFRVSYGELGNMGGNNVGNYEYQTIYNLANYPLGDLQKQGLAITGLPNELLTWESTAMTNFGLDANFFRNRLSVTMDIYNKQTKGILYQPDIYLTMGHKTAPRLNIAQVRNRGFELNASWSDHIGKVTYAVTGNFSYNQNLVNKYKGQYSAGWVTGPDGKPQYVNNIGEVSTGGTSRVVEGKMMNEYYLLTPYKGSGKYFNTDGSVNKNGGPKDGMIRTKEDMQWLQAMIKAGYKFRPNMKASKDKIWYGDYIYADNNGDGTYGGTDDSEFQGTSRRPKFNYGLQMSAVWNGFDISLNWVAASGFHLYWAANRYNSTATRHGYALSQYIMNDHYFFDPDHPDDPRTNINARYPRLTGGEKGSQNTEASTLFLYDGSFLKLQNLTFGYSLPKQVLNANFVKSCRFYVSMENLFTLTAFPGIDPEMGAAPKYPVLRQFAFGVNVSF